MTRDTLALLHAASTATLTTVLREHGLRNTFMHGVAPLRPDCRVAGPAFTLRYIPAREDLDDRPVDNSPTRSASPSNRCSPATCS